MDAETAKAFEDLNMRFGRLKAKHDALGAIVQVGLAVVDRAHPEILRSIEDEFAKLLAPGKSIGAVDGDLIRQTLRDMAQVRQGLGPEATSP